MRYTILALTVALCLALVSSNPLPENGLRSEDVNPESENRVNEAEAESQNNEVRVQFADDPPQTVQELAALGEDETDDEDRDKRGSAPAGSGNFLFDVIRMVASSGSNFWGSGEKPVIGPTEGMTMAIPGPLTRLFLIANRGWMNMVEDLVYRMAQTSEKFVDYKAKLIKWLI